jgi:hypothetical protein
VPRREFPTRRVCAMMGAGGMRYIHLGGCDGVDEDDRLGGVKAADKADAADPTHTHAHTEWQRGKQNVRASSSTRPVKDGRWRRALAQRADALARSRSL